MTKYELALKLFGTDCSITSRNGFIRVILTMESGGFLSKAFTADDSLRWSLDKVAFMTFLQDIKRIVIKATTTPQLSTWEFGFEFDKALAGQTAASLSSKREFHLDISYPDDWAERKPVYIVSPDYDPDDEDSFWDECKKIADWIEENQPERNKINLTGFQAWNRLVPLMDKVVSGIAAGVWEKAPPDKSTETAYYSWELELDSGQKQTVSIVGEILAALVSAIAVADSTSLEFGSASIGSGLIVLIGIDDTFSV